MHVVVYRIADIDSDGNVNVEDDIVEEFDVNPDVDGTHYAQVQEYWVQITTEA
jgi:hypothetical protein